MSDLSVKSGIIALAGRVEGLTKALQCIREVIDAWSDLAADPPKWAALTELPPSPHSALSLIWAYVDNELATSPSVAGEGSEP